MNPIVSSFVFTLCLFTAVIGGAEMKKKGKTSGYEPKEGDIVFQSLPNPPGLDLVDAIEGSTGSPYSHCGMVVREGTRWKVIEAIGPVQQIPLEQWIARGREKAVWAYRLDAASQKHVPDALVAMRK